MISLNRHEEFRLNRLNHFFQIFLFRVAAGMNIHHSIVNNFYSFPIKFVRQPLDCAFISGNDGGRKHERVAGFRLNKAMLAVGDSHQNRPVFALSAGRQNHDFVVGIALHFFNRNHGIFRYCDVAQLFRDFNVYLHAPSFNDYLFSVPRSDLNDFVQSAEQGRKSAENQAAFGAFDDFFNVGHNVQFAGLFSYFARVGAVVNFEISGMEDDSRRRADDDAERGRDVMADAEKFNVKSAQFQFGIFVYNMSFQFDRIGFILFKSLANDRQNQVRAVNRGIAELGNQMRDGAYVVVMGVGDYHSTDVFFFSLKIFDVWNDVINAWHVLFRKLQAHVDDYDVVLVFDNGHVASDFFNSPQRNDPEGFIQVATDDFLACLRGQARLLARQAGRPKIPAYYRLRLRPFAGKHASG